MKRSTEGNAPSRPVIDRWYSIGYSLPMNALAKELNETLQGTAALELLSDFGKRFFFPKGIITQTSEAKKLAHKFNATVGMAFEKKQPIILKPIQDKVPALKPSESVAW